MANSDLKLAKSIGIYENWEQVLISTEKALTPSGYLSLKEKYPTVFKDTEDREVISAHVEIITYEFAGEHTCSPEDVRMRFTARTYGYCIAQEKEQADSQSSLVKRPRCLRSFVLYTPDTTDPCK